MRNLTKNLEFQEARVAQLRADAAEQQGKIERYRALEEVLGKENEALRKDLKETREERDRSLRRAEASEIMAAHAKNEVAALESGQVSERRFTMKTSSSSVRLRSLIPQERPRMNT